MLDLEGAQKGCGSTYQQAVHVVIGFPTIDVTACFFCR